MARGRAAAVGLALLSLACLFLACLFLACASVPPASQRFLRLETPRFVLLSSLGREETARLAMDLESFEAAVDFVLEQPFDPTREGRTLVLAFDDRGPARRFATRDETAYWLPDASRPILVFRTPGGWDRRADRDLLHRYAHRVIRARSRQRLPPWLEEGLAQLIGSLERNGAEIRIGAPIPEFVRVIRDWRRSQFTRVLQREWSAGETSGERLEWSAVCWAIAHLEWSTSADRREALRGALTTDATRGAPSSSAARTILERDPERLADQINEHIALERFRVDRVRALGDSPDLDRLKPIPPAESLVALGELALELSHASVARQAFERALEERPDDAVATVGLARAWADSPELAQPLVRRAEAMATDEPRATLGLARHFLETALREEDEAERRRLATRALELYRRVGEADSTNVEALMGRAAARITLGDELDPVEAMLDRAAALRPGSLEIDLARARLAMRRNQERYARFIAVDVLSRTHEPRLIRRARALLDEASR